MSKSRITIHYHDFHPTEFSKEFIESMINEIERELPVGSSVRLNFSIKDELVKGMLQVASGAGPLFSVAAAEDIREVALKLVQQMRRRMDRFKTKRRDRFGLKYIAKSNMNKIQGGDEYDAGVA